MIKLMVQVLIHSQTAGSQVGLSHGQRPWFLKALCPLFAGPILLTAFETSGLLSSFCFYTWCLLKVGGFNP